MPYELYHKSAARNSADPRVTITQIGRMHFNSAAAHLLDEKRVEHAHLLFDKEKNKVALKPAARADDDTYKMHYKQSKGGSGFAARTFLRHINYKNGASAVFPCEWNEKQSMLEFSLREPMPARPRREKQ